MFFDREARRRIRETSIDSFNRCVAEGVIEGMKLKTLTLLREHGPCTSAELWQFAKKEKGFTTLRDPFQKRLGELADEGAVEIIGKRRCTTSPPDHPRTSRVYDITGRIPVKPTEKKLSKHDRKLIERILNEIDSCAAIAEKWGGPIVAQAIREERKKAWGFNPSTTA